MQNMSSGGEDKSKITYPLDKNASYLDKSGTRPFDNLLQTPSISQNTGSQQNIDQFDSRKHSQDSKVGGAQSKGGSSPSAGPLQTRKIDSTSSMKSGEEDESAPEAAQPELPAGGLARVTSYPKIGRNIEQEDLDSSLAL